MAFCAFTHCLCLSYLLAIVLSAGMVGFEKTSMTVPENIGQVTFCINFYKDILTRVEGEVATTNPNKEDPVTSVGNFSGHLFISAPNNITCFNASVLDNNYVEFGIPKEYFLNITIGDSFIVYVQYKENQRTLKLTITDDDTVLIGFSKTSLTVSESDGNVTVCMNREGEARSPAGGVPPEALSVRLSTVQGTTASNDDFTPLNSYLVDFGLNETFKCIDVSIINDNKPEHMETFYITMTNSSSYVTVNETRNNLTVNIMNDDYKATAQFEEEYNREIEENAEEKVVELGCVINQTSQTPLRIGFETDNSSSTAIVDKDFTIVNKSLTFPPGKNRVSLQIKINHDCVAESPKILVLRMISLDEQMVIIGKNNTAKVKILDKFDNEEAAKQKQKQQEIEDEKRRDIYTLLIVAIVLTVLLFLCGIVVFACFIIKLKQA